MSCSSFAILGKLRPHSLPERWHILLVLGVGVLDGEGGAIDEDETAAPVQFWTNTEAH